MNMLLYNEINLLPPAEQYTRKVRVYGRRAGVLIRVGILMTVALLLVQGVVIGGYYWATERLEVDGTPVLTAMQDTQQRVHVTNETIRMLAAWFGQYQPWSPLLRDVLGAIPSQIEFSSLSLNEEQQTLLMTGQVTNRVEVVNFQRQLEELPWVTDIVAPLSNFETGAEATFSFTVKR